MGQQLLLHTNQQLEQAILKEQEATQNGVEVSEQLRHTMDSMRSDFQLTTGTHATTTKDLKIACFRKKQELKKQTALFEATAEEVQDLRSSNHMKGEKISSLEQ